MIKKYFPFILLLAAAFLLYWVKTHQRGPAPSSQIEIPAVKPATVEEEEAFNRNINNIVYSKHARCRMDCRHIDESEVKQIIKDGTINYAKIEEDSKGKTYPLEGVTHDKQHVRVVIAPHAGELVVVTVIDLDTDWACECR